MRRGEGREFATPHDALREAVSIIGSQAATARLLGVAQPSVWKWLDRAKELPAQHVRAVEAATGIAKEELRPDLYGPPPLVPTHDAQGDSPA